ncbi:MAG: hypothetical protein RL398_1536 [Planctomycetota bacterium]
MADEATFRRLALDLPEVVEGGHHGNADFRTAGRVFASVHPGGATAMVRLELARQQQLLQAPTPCLTPANGAWGKQGCTLIALAAARDTLLRSLLTDAWETAHAARAKRDR